ncbi:unnamed protein product [Cyclocybe aegerita]|uniref:Uncharacterized protein n=1 Tax=Cyclocybe aegerita TaxID=1973307 RepID=A0A8S0VZ01_CYCAE|nr:unnamed protein product [Cyclocybe aegerita]
MKFTSILVSALAACVSLVRVAAAPVTVELEKRTSPLPLHLRVPTIFYRGVTQRELAHIANYQKGHHPTFSYRRARFHIHGDAYTTASPNPAHKVWYLVTFKYTPNTVLKTKSFATGTDEWKLCVSNYARTKPATHYGLIEGPVSH